MMAYASWSVVFGEQPSAAKWNILGTNDASFNDGTGIGNATITANKLATGAANATVATSETTTSTSYTDLTTTTDTVTVTVGANGLALVCLYTQFSHSVNTGTVYVSFVGSGANTIAASDTYALLYQEPLNSPDFKLGIGTPILLTGLTAGSTTFKMKYKIAVAGTGTFLNRRIAVIPL